MKSACSVGCPPITIEMNAEFIPSLCKLQNKLLNQYLRELKYTGSQTSYSGYGLQELGNMLSIFSSNGLRNSIHFFSFPGHVRSQFSAFQLYGDMAYVICFIKCSSLHVLWLPMWKQLVLGIIYLFPSEQNACP